MGYTISKRFDFSASHQLTHLAREHPCARLHGHNYCVVVELADDSLDERGFVLDYGELAFVKEYVEQTLDHRHLNDVLGTSQATTAENLSRHFAELVALHVPSFVSVTARVSETPKTWASYTKGG